MSTHFKSSHELGKTNLQKKSAKDVLNKIEIQPLREIDAYKYQIIEFKDVNEFKQFYNDNYDYINNVSTRGLNIMYHIPGYKLGRKQGEVVLFKTHLKQGTQAGVNGFKSHSDNEIDVNDLINTWSDAKFEDNEQRQFKQDLINDITGNTTGFGHDLGSYSNVDIDEVLEENPKAPCNKAYAVGCEPEKSEYDDLYKSARNKVATEKKWEEIRRQAASKVMV